MRQIVSFWSDGQPLGFYLNIYLNKFCLLCPGQRAWTIWGRWSVNFESEFMNLPKFRFRWERTLDFMTRAWLSQCLEMKNVTSVVNCGFFEAQHMCVWARYIFPRPNRLSSSLSSPSYAIFPSRNDLDNVCGMRQMRKISVPWNWSNFEHNSKSPHETNWHQILNYTVL